MGAKTWMLVYAEDDAREALKKNPELDREATDELARILFPSDTLQPLEDGDLAWTSPPDGEICIGSFPGVSVVAAKEIGIDKPSELPRSLVDVFGDGTITLHAMHSVVDWFAFAQWNDGKLTRSLSLSPDSGVVEDIGEKMPFERPYWSGEHPAVEDDEDEYPLPFHPLELGEEALKEFFGYQLEGLVDESLLEPENVPLMRFNREQESNRKKKPRWKFW